MRFEFDENKSDANRQKHGIDFVEAQRLWSDEDFLVVPARSDDEHRYLAIGLIGVLHWAAVYTLRRNVIRIISVRRAQREERMNYESR
ncbi:BrnT family toxin [Aureimonas phyllosphaerae]|uniref:Uncharacterized protein n=1 Tax=Aureimonas phyllosphaerae TaxID=1166078 RepID=A0A7W6FV82_9HYPH|nr:BrnT family toxin [Aureimonas phyllosphaerae]MBB3935762.1 hypothetical protein [Aureimonas phyllosphaerae]MBB3959770.1 hypothetical protein [Aureimonas phyllosphaerae]SFF14820.1 hypothetical protein SAMN05216566_103301 [Aureimonas phyllosphaerae]